MQPNQTNAAVELKKKLMPLFHAIQSEIASQVMKDPDFKFNVETVIDGCQIEVNFPAPTVVATLPKKYPKLPTKIPLPAASGL